MTKHVGAAACLAFALWPLGASAVPVTQVGSFTFSVTASDSTLQVPYDANLPLSGFYPHLERAVVLLHGSSRSAANALETLNEAADLAGAEFTSLLVAPQFLIEEDITAHQLPARYLFWSESGWKEGDRSLSTVLHPRPVRLSSFAIVDSMLVRMGGACPNLETIVFAGHSAGGQFVQRFAAGSTAADALNDAFGVEVQYSVANPSSYLYLDAQRPVPPSLNQFAVPAPALVQACPGYDDYKYGLQDRNTYMSRLSSTQIVNNYRDARVTVLLGELDDDPGSAELDTTCAAMLQGADRQERGRAFGYYMRHKFGASIADRHQTIVVPDVGHSAEDIFKSPCGVATLFGGGGCDPVDAVPNAEVTGALAPGLWIDSHPNPFRIETTIVYRMPAGESRPTVKVYDVRGRLVRSLRGDLGPDGRGAVVWDGRSSTGQRLPAGVYLYRLQLDSRTVIERSTLLR